MSIRKLAGWLLLAVVALGVPFYMPSAFYLHLANQAVIFAIVVVGYNILLGYCGQISLGHAAFFGLGAYVGALLAVDYHVSFWLGLLAAGAAAALLGVLVGLPSLKLKGHYLAIATIGMGVIVQLVLTNWTPVTKGSVGVRGIPPPQLPGFTINTEGRFFYFMLAVLIVMSVLAVRVRDSKYGRAFNAIRNSELAAEVCGLNSTAIKTLAFTISALFAGIGGSLYASWSTYISPDTFNFDQSALFLIMLLVGGNGTIAGSIAGAVLLTYLPELLRPLGDSYQLVYGAGVVLIVIYLPSGFVGLVRRWAFARKLGAKPAAAELGLGATS